MKFKCLSILMMCCVQIGFANSLTIPKACPALDVLKTVHFTVAAPDHILNWIPYDINHYGTPEDWLFSFYVFYIKDKETAIERANLFLPYLSTTRGPVQSDDGKSWACFYTSPQEDFAVAYTPANIGLLRR